MDDDEIEFLDEIRANKRAEEERVRRETEEGLKAFRERQKGGAAQGENAGVKEEGESWEIGRKRKRTKEKDVKGLRRKVSAGEEKETGTQDTKPVEGTSHDTLDEKSSTTSQSAAKPPEKKGLVLVGYGSNSDDDD